MTDQVQKQAEKLATDFELANEGQISFHTVVNDLKHLSPHSSQTVIDQANQKLTADGKVGDLTIAGLDTEDNHKLDVWSAGGDMKVMDSKGHSHGATRAQMKSTSDRLARTTHEGGSIYRTTLPMRKCRTLTTSLQPTT